MDMNINSSINDFFETMFVSDISLDKILFVLIISATLGFFVFFVYRFTINNNFYSKDFNRCLVIMPIITSAIFLTVQSSLVISLGILGSLSIVRFRTAIKSPLDLLFLFWSISLGIISGSGLYSIAIVLCIIVAILLILIDKIKSPSSLKLLVIECESIDDEKVIIEKIKENTNYFNIKSETITQNKVEIVIEYKTKSDNFNKVISDIEEVKQYAILNHDKDNMI